MSTPSYISTGRRESHPFVDSPLLKWLHRLNDYLYLTEESHTQEARQVHEAKKELRALGFSRFQLDRRESADIASYLHAGEHVRAGIRGHIYGTGSVMLIATDSRVMYLHEVPLLKNFEEFPYDAISGISINQSGYLASVTLFTKLKTYQIDYVAKKQALRFTAFIESHIYPLKNRSTTRRQQLARL